MAVVGFVLIIISHQINKDIPSSVENELLKYKEVIEVYHLFGAYDLIVKIQCDTREEIGKFVVNTVRKIDGVGDTKTLMGSNYE